MSNTAQFKRGDTFSCTWVWTPEEDEPQDLLGVTITSTLRDRCGTEYALAVTVDEDGLGFVTNYDGDTAGWGLGAYAWDIRFVFTSPTIKTTSKTFRLEVLESITTT